MSTVPRLTQEQAAIISAYTGVLCGGMAPYQEYIERILGREVFHHDISALIKSGQIKEAARADFLAIVAVES